MTPPRGGAVTVIPLTFGSAIELVATLVPPLKVTPLRTHQSSAALPEVNVIVTAAVPAITPILFDCVPVHVGALVMVKPAAF